MLLHFDLEPTDNCLVDLNISGALWYKMYNYNWEKIEKQFYLLFSFTWKNLVKVKH